MYSRVTGLSKIPSGVEITAARVPTLISNSFRSLEGMTTWPFVVKVTMFETLLTCMKIVVYYFKSKSLHLYPTDELEWDDLGADQASLQDATFSAIDPAINRRATLGHSYGIILIAKFSLLNRTRLWLK